MKRNNWLYCDSAETETEFKKFAREYDSYYLFYEILNRNKHIESKIQEIQCALASIFEELSTEAQEGILEKMRHGKMRFERIEDES